MSGLIMAADGTFTRIELKGPPDFDAWLACFRVYRAAMIMLSAIGVADLDRYIDRITQLLRDYGACVWHLLYQADVRMRREEIPTIRRILTAERNAIIKAGGQHPFDPDKPWRLAWKHASGPESKAFWEDEFITPATHVRIHLKSLGQVVDGDAPVDEKKIVNSAEVPSHQRDPLPAPPAPPARAHVDDRDRRGQKRPVSQGVYRFDRNNKQKGLCDDFQNGRCTPCVRGSTICPHNSNLRHQCANCLRDDHGADRCRAQERDEDDYEPQRRPRGRGRGRDRGRGRGAGRDRGRGRGRGRDRE